MWSTFRNRFWSISRSVPTAMVGKKVNRSFAGLMLLSTAIGGSSFCFSSLTDQSAHDRQKCHEREHHKYKPSKYLLATSASNSIAEVSSQTKEHSSTESRTYSTKADQYFQQYQRIPLPYIIHDNLDRMMRDETQRAITSTSTYKRLHNNRILVIGDVHGCLEELKSLVQKATNDHNDNKQFAAIVLVGDVCNKGPWSADAIAYVRNQPNWYSIRGNHEDRALAAALGDEECCAKPKYQWVKSLSDEDVTWMSNLPYTITIPNTMFKGASEAKQDIIIVHAGLDPAVGLNSQETNTMITVRNLIVDKQPKAWAKIWQGPDLVIFGHDAKRGLQREKYAIGLDSGCVYGKKLTGIVLPERELVSVDAVAEHCSIKKKA